MVVAAHVFHPQSQYVSGRTLAGYGARDAEGRPRSMNEQRGAHGAPAAPPKRGLPRSETKHQFSLAIVHLVVSAASLRIKDHRTDYAWGGITSGSSHEWEPDNAPKLELAVK